jgi:hypothetical protein
LAAHRKRASLRPYPTAPVLNIESNRNFAKDYLLPLGEVWSHRKFGELGFMASGDSSCSVRSNGHPADVVLSDLVTAFGHSTVGMSTAPAGLSTTHAGLINPSAGLSAGPIVSRTGMPIPVLGISVGTREEGGAQIVATASGGVADLAYLHVGDVIDEVDGKAIKTPMELAAELSSRAPGSKIHLATWTTTL